ncbi:MAG: hypothetical protein EBZ47_01645 [Chlamydiae bacterium]|nr:hypothetical protein [Chlamydiota bacterium]
MNKGKQQLSLRVQKKVIKTVKKDLKSKEDSITKTMPRRYPTEAEMLAPIPSKKAKIDRAHLVSMEKSIHRKKAKAQSKHSKRTNTGMTSEQSPPAHPHVEGQRWIKTVVKQNTTNAEKIFRKSAKRK